MYQISVEYFHPLQRKVRKTESGTQTDGQTKGKLVVPFGLAGRGIKKVPLMMVIKCTKFLAFGLCPVYNVQTDR
jgi:hypothetical protein